MLLRWIVGNYLKQSAESAWQRVVRQAAEFVHPSGEPPQIPEHFQIAVVAGLGLELAGMAKDVETPASYRFGKAIEHWGPIDALPVRIVELGVGAERAAQSTRELIARRRPAWIVAAGFATALQPHLKRGDLLMADHLLSPDGRSLAVGFHVDQQILAATPYLRVGSLVSLDHIAAQRKERDALAAQTQALACDMESLAVAEVCQHEHIRFLSVRIITDELEEELPAEIAQLLHQKTVAGKLGVAAGAVFQRPASVKDLWHLREDAQKASLRLAKFLRGVLPQLSLPQPDTRPGDESAAESNRISPPE
jgi:adenosylhomocysteine nucleosidase